MTKISVDSSLIKEALAELELKDQAFVKLAAYEQELEVVYRVINLVQSGHIDPMDMHEKVAEFVEDPESLMIFEKAVELRSGGGSLGRLTEDSSDEISKIAAYGDTAEVRLYSTLTDIIRG